MTNEQQNASQSRQTGQEETLGELNPLVGQTKTLAKDAPNTIIEPRSSREQDLRRNDTREKRETRKNSRTKKGERMVGGKNTVAKKLKEAGMRLRHAPLKPIARKN